MLIFFFYKTRKKYNLIGEKKGCLGETKLSLSIHNRKPGFFGFVISWEKRPFECCH